MYYKKITKKRVNKFKNPQPSSLHQKWITYCREARWREGYDCSFMLEWVLHRNRAGGGWVSHRSFVGGGWGWNGSQLGFGRSGINFAGEGWREWNADERERERRRWGDRRERGEETERQIGIEREREWIFIFVMFYFISF